MKRLAVLMLFAILTGWLAVGSASAKDKCPRGGATDGNPAHACVDLNGPQKQPLQDNNPALVQPTPSSTSFPLKHGDTLWDIAFRECGDHQGWWNIAKASGIVNHYTIPDGYTITIVGQCEDPATYQSTPGYQSGSAEGAAGARQSECPTDRPTRYGCPAGPNGVPLGSDTGPDGNTVYGPGSGTSNPDPSIESGKNHPAGDPGGF